MSHSSEKRWDQVAAKAEEAAVKMVDSLLHVESIYQDLLELYAYVGSTAQALADQLFKETWQNRSTPGLQAQMTVDVTAGAVTAVAITQGGTGYVDAVGYQLTVSGGANDAIISYDVVGGVITNAAVVAGGSTYPDGAGQVVNGIPAPNPVPDTEANAEEVAKAQDLIDVMTSVHELYQAADNVPVGAEDRFAKMRRFT